MPIQVGVLANDVQLGHYFNLHFILDLPLQSLPFLFVDHDHAIIDFLRELFLDLQNILDELWIVIKVLPHQLQ